jgi:digeranylgeranylglycerophospholipid reductase
MTSCGTSPKYAGKDTLAQLNLLVVGDAARVVDSLTGAGIANAMLSGKMAGEAAARYVGEAGRTIQGMWDDYPGRFVDKKHTELSRLLEIKRFVSRLTDSDLDDAVLALGEYFGGKAVQSISVTAVLLGMLKAKPRLLTLARHLL